MQITKVNGLVAICHYQGEDQLVDLSLVGEQPPSTWLLVFLGAARSVIEADEAAQIDNAIAALAAANRGESVDHFFADLIDRPPELPEFLREQHQKNLEKEQNHG